MKRLTRSTQDRKIAGVCGGLGHHFGMDPTLIRLGLVLLAFLTAGIPVIAGYVVAWAIIPEDTTVTGVHTGPPPPASDTDASTT